MHSKEINRMEGNRNVESGVFIYGERTEAFY